MIRAPLLIRSIAFASLAIATACSEWPLGNDDPGARVGLDEEVAGEVDGGEVVYEVVGVRGRKTRVLFQAMSGDPGDLLHLKIEGATTAYQLGATTSAGDAPTLSGQATSWFVFPGSVPYRIRVRGAGPDDGGPFRFRFQTASRDIVIGDTLSGAIFPLPEGLDVDEYRFEASAGQQLGLVMSVWSSPAQVWLELFHRQGLLVTLNDGSPVDGGVYSSAYRFRAPSTGEYRIRLAGMSEYWAEPGTGGYRLELFEVATSPEAVEEWITPGAVTEESIDRPGDVDEFRITAGAGDEVNVILRTIPWVFGVQYDAGVPQHPGGGPIIRVLDGSGGTIALAGRATQRLVLKESAEYTVRVEDPNPWSVFTGPYRLELHAVERGHEQGDSLLRTGEWTGGEIESIGDIDTFTFRGAPGQEIAVFGRREEGVPVEIRNADGSVAVPMPAGAYDCLIRYSCGGVAYTIPESGEFRLTARQVIDEAHTLLEMGAYEVLVNAISREPETAPVLLELRKTVETESYFPAGDIDEFEFDVAQGTHIRVVLEAPRPLRMEVVDLATDSTLAVETSGPFGVSLSPRADGRYRVRISARPPSPNQYDSINWVPSETVPYSLTLRCALPEPWETPDCSGPE